MGDAKERVRGVVEQYVKGCQVGDVELLQSVFHADAQMVGFLGGNLLYGGAEPFYEAVSNNPSPQDSGADYQTEISDVVVAATVATATLKETGFMGMNFTNYFHFLLTDEGWKIVSKVFSHE